MLFNFYKNRCWNIWCLRSRLYTFQPIVIGMLRMIVFLHQLIKSSLAHDHIVFTTSSFEALTVWNTGIILKAWII